MKSRERKREEKKVLDKLVVGKSAEAEDLRRQIKALQAEAHYLREYMVQSMLQSPTAALPLSEHLQQAFKQALLSMPSPFDNITPEDLCKIQTYSLPIPPISEMAARSVQ
jgi:hypothetical protein